MARQRNTYLTQPDDKLLAACTVETCRGSGPGGQHRNKRDSAVRLTHKPTGVVAAATERAAASTRTAAGPSNVSAKPSPWKFARPRARRPTRCGPCSMAPRGRASAKEALPTSWPPPRSSTTSMPTRGRRARPPSASASPQPPSPSSSCWMPTFWTPPTASAAASATSPCADRTTDSRCFRRRVRRFS